jgi:hypothetical protein
MIDSADAAKTVIPTCMLASGEENEEEVKNSDRALRVGK